MLVIEINVAMTLCCMILVIGLLNGFWVALLFFNSEKKEKKVKTKEEKLIEKLPGVLKKTDNGITDMEYFEGCSGKDMENRVETARSKQTNSYNFVARK